MKSKLRRTAVVVWSALAGGLSCSSTTASEPVTTLDGGTSEASAEASNQPDASTVSEGGKSEASGPSLFSFDATLSGAAPAGSRAVVLWSVSSGSPDYVFNFGHTTVTGTDVFVSFNAEPPVDALNAGVLGVGVVVLVDANAPVPEGKIASSQKFDILGIAKDHAIIFRAPTDAAVKAGWWDQFQNGFACGKCVRSDATFDSFDPVDCNQTTIELTTSLNGLCNWT